MLLKIPLKSRATVDRQLGAARIFCRAEILAKPGRIVLVAGLSKVTTDVRLTTVRRNNEGDEVSLREPVPTLSMHPHSRDIAYAAGETKTARG